MEEFKVGQVFEGIYPSLAAQWCNEQGDCFIDELEPVDGVRHFEIKKSSAEELKQRKISVIKSALSEIDLKSIRAIRAGEAEYIEVYETQAQELRARLAELE